MFTRLRSSTWRRSRWLLVAVGALLAAAAGAGYAAIPDANGVIHGCYSKGKGVLRIVDTEQGETCASNETAIQWNQTGPPGPQGPGAFTSTFTVPAGGELVPLLFIDGLVIKGACGVNDSTVLVDFDPSVVVPGVRGRLFGYRIGNDGMNPVLFDSFGGVSATGVAPVLSLTGGFATAANPKFPHFIRLDIQGSNGGGLDCTFDAMITPSS